MRLRQLHIKNFRCCRDVFLEIGDIHALVGANNSGKSTVLRALDFLLNPSTKSLNGDSFWGGDTSLEIRVEAVFSDLTTLELEQLRPYIRPDGTFEMARSARMETGDGDQTENPAQGSDKIVIGQQYKGCIPTPMWLRDDEINDANVRAWWNQIDALEAGGVSFGEFLGATRCPRVGGWKQAAARFVQEYAGTIQMSDVWIDNPRGYANVLKGTLPLFVLVPAVRDVSDESKGTRTSPFGKLLCAILDSLTGEVKAKIETALVDVAKQMNRTGGDQRAPLITQTENKLKELLNSVFDGCDLELEFEMPTLEAILGSPKLYVNDGLRTVVENKGHGLQRAMIFAILRCYAEAMVSTTEGNRRSLILAVEEPELYMHPQAQRTIRRVFRSLASQGDQVLFSTHSALLVDVAHFDEIIRLEASRVEVDGKISVVSRAWQLPMSRMIEDLETRIPALRGQVSSQSMSERYSHAYNPHRNEGFFASRIVLVEGLTEEYSLPIYAEAMEGCQFDWH